MPRRMFRHEAEGKAFGKTKLHSVRKGRVTKRFSVFWGRSGGIMGAYIFTLYVPVLIQ